MLAPGDPESQPREAKLESVSLDTEASHTRSIAMVNEMRGLLHEMRHAGAVPGESPGAALTGVTTPRMILVTDTGTPAEPAVVAVAGSHSRRRQRPTIPEAVPPLRRRRRWMCRRQAVPPPALSALRVDRRRAYCS